jgi:hypothetical protein
VARLQRVIEKQNRLLQATDLHCREWRRRAEKLLPLQDKVKDLKRSLRARKALLVEEAARADGAASLARAAELRVRRARVHPSISRDDDVHAQVDELAAANRRLQLGAAVARTEASLETAHAAASPQAEAPREAPAASAAAQ